MRPFHQYWLLILLLTVAHLASAQFERFYENWRWSQFTTKSGLPSNIVDDLLESRDGTVWVSTSKGIAFYDGFRWNPITIDAVNGTKRATRIGIGRSNKILVILEGYLYEGNKHGFKKIEANNLLIEKVVSACAVENDELLITTFLQHAPSIFLDRNGNARTQTNLSTGTVRITKSKRILFANAFGLFEYNKNKFTDVLPYGFVRTISENDHGFGVLSLDSPRDMIGVWEWDNKRTPQLSSSERGLPVRSLDVSSTNDVIVAYETGNIRIRRSGHWNELSPIPPQMVGLVFVKYTKGDNLWVGTEQGLYYFRNTDSKWMWWRSKHPSPKNIVMELLHTSNGDLWIGTMSGVNIRKTNGSFISIDKIDGMDLGLVTGIEEDERHNIWISSGASFSGAYRWDGNAWKHFGVKEGLKSPRVQKIRKDNNGNLWFMGMAASGETIHGDNEDPGVFSYNGKIFTHIDVKDGLLNGRMYSFASSKDGSYWFGSKAGISKWSSNRWMHWDKTVLHNVTSIYSLAVDKKNNIWFSTFSSTLGYIDSSGVVHWVWDWLTDADYKQKVWDIKVDSEGSVWVATTRGLYRYKDGIWSTFDTESEYGLKELRVVLPLNDRIIVGGHGIGVGILNRSKISTPIKTELEDPIVEKYRVLVRWSVYPYWNEMPVNDIETRFRVDDDEWSEWSKQREAILFSLSDGEHVLTLQTKDVNGVVVPTDQKILFTVPPPLYKEPIFVLLISMSVLIITSMALHAIRVKKHHKKALEDQRTRIANDLHDEVGSNLGSLTLLSQKLVRMKGLPDRVARDLKIISQTTLQTSDFLKDVVWYINPRYDSFVNLEVRMREIGSKMLHGYNVDFTMVNESGGEMPKLQSRRNIILMYKEIVHNIIKHSKATGVEISCIHRSRFFYLRVKDNGIGFNADTIKHGNGLYSLKRRAEDTGAQLSIAAYPGRGTEIIITFAGAAYEQ